MSVRFIGLAGLTNSYNEYYTALNGFLILANSGWVSRESMIAQIQEIGQASAMQEIISIAGSPSRTAKSAYVLRYVQTALEAKGWRTKTIAVRDLPAEDLLFARLDSGPIQEAHRLLDQAQAVIVATPVYKAAYSGVLKAFLDLLPQEAFKGKIVLPMATGGSQAHLLAIDYALKPVLGALGATHILRGVYLLDSLLQVDTDGTLQIETALEQRLTESLDELNSLLCAQRTLLELNLLAGSK